MFIPAATGAASAAARQQTATEAAVRQAVTHSGGVNQLNKDAAARSIQEVKLQLEPERLQEHETQETRLRLNPAVKRSQISIAVTR